MSPNGTAAVVRVYATTQPWNYDTPWQPEATESCTGSGVVIGEGQVLTGAHVVANATFLQVQKVSDPNKAVATVEAIWHDCDLALLRVEEAGFFAGITPPEIGGLPDLQDKVSVVGYPVGGEQISITEGVVSRIEVTEYSHSQRDLLAVTIDAAINDGNSGGPVYRDGKIAGVAFQALNDAENIGEMVPTTLIRRFLQAVERQVEPGVPGLGVLVQNLENPRMREDLGLGPEESGVLVLSVQYGTSAWGVLQPGDALLELDGLKIANDGTVQYRDRYRMSFDVALGDHFLGEPLPATILRGGKRVQVSLELRPFRQLVPRSQYDVRPRYFIYGGLVFQPLTRNLLCAWTNWWQKAPKEYLHLYYSGERTEACQEVVVCSTVLADEINVGYENTYNEVVQEVNGERPCDLADFVRRVEASQGRVEVRTTKGLCVFDPAAVPAANARILERYHIGADRNLTP